jgi:hypothetical protein
MNQAREVCTCGYSNCLRSNITKQALQQVFLVPACSAYTQIIIASVISDCTYNVLASLVVVFCQASNNYVMVVAQSGAGACGAETRKLA